MAPSKLPVCCSPAAFGLLTKVSGSSSIDSPVALLNGAIAISMHEMDDVDPSAVEATIQGYADTVRSRVRGRQPQALLAHLHDVLFEEEGFRGNTQDYYASGNSYVPAVLETKRGLPITLSLFTGWSPSGWGSRRGAWACRGISSWASRRAMRNRTTASRG